MLHPENNAPQGDYSQNGHRLVVKGTLVCGLLPIGGALMSGNSLLWVGLAAAIFALLSLLSLKIEPSNGRVLASVALIGEIIVVTGSLKSHQWQVDSHMAFFAALACLMVLNDRKAVLVATGVLIFHHVSLAILMPSLIYPPADLFANVERVLIHGAAAVVEAVALNYALILRRRMDERMEADKCLLKEANEQAKTNLIQAQTALQDAKVATQAAEEARKEAIEAAQRAEEEATRAQKADSEALAAKERDAQRQFELHEKQRLVVEALGCGLGSLSQKDLRVRITEPFPEEYEGLRRDFNQTAQALGDAILVVVETSQSIAYQTQGIASATSDLAQRTESQAATLAELATTVTHVAGQEKENAQNADTANNDAKLTSADATTSLQLVNDAVTAMDRIEESSGQITSIIDTIEEISFQTNLLALNAGVEAARAGETGRGFAVVASEVRALAQRSADAALEIKTLIETSTSMVKNGVSLVKRTGDSLGSVTSRVADIAQRVEEISASADRQSGSLREIDESLAQLDRVTQLNAAMFEETTASNQDLKQQTEQLLTTVSDFDLDTKTLDDDRQVA